MTVKNKVLLLFFLRFFFTIEPSKPAGEYAVAKREPLSTVVEESQVVLSEDEEVTLLETNHVVAVLHHCYRRRCLRALHRNSSEEEVGSVSATANNSSEQHKSVNSPVAFRKLFSCACYNKVNFEEEKEQQKGE